MGACDISVHLQDRFCSSPEALVFKTFLVPVDIAHLETAGPAIERAVTMAIASRGSVRLLYVHPILPFTYSNSLPSWTKDNERQSKNSRPSPQRLPFQRSACRARSGAGPFTLSAR